MRAYVVSSHAHAANGKRVHTEGECAKKQRTVSRLQAGFAGGSVGGCVVCVSSVYFVTALEVDEKGEPYCDHG